MRCWHGTGSTGGALLLLAAGGLVMAPAVAAPSSTAERPGRSAPAASGELSAAEARQIQAVVAAQLKAFASDDAAGAFALASPKIREMFGDADRFLTMVKGHYPVVYRPATVEFMPPRRIDGAVTQAVRLTDARGALWLAVYTMERQKGGAWRIAGCELAEIEGRVA